LSSVLVGVVDTGINVRCGEFDKTTVANAHKANGDNAGMSDADGHGTQVAGVIAADDGDGGVNGMASRVLGGKLGLVWGNMGRDLMETLNSTTLVIEAGASIVNMSFVFGPFAAQNNPVWVVWKRQMEIYPDVLFAAAAQNLPVELFDWNDAPAGIPVSNLITVGGSAACDPRQAWPDSAFGAPIGLAAQADNVPVVEPNLGQPHDWNSGNSFATPQVAAAAAILKAVDPSLTPTQIIETYLRQEYFAGPVPQGGRLLSTTLPFERLLLDHGTATSQEIRDVVALQNTGASTDNTVPSGLVVARICGGIYYVIPGVGSWDATPPGPNDSGSMNSASWAIASQPPDGDMTLAIGGYAPFTLGDVQLLEQQAAQEQGQAALAVSRLPEDQSNISTGHATGGTLTFIGCRIEQRDPAYHQPIVVSVDGAFSGNLTYVVAPAPDILYTTFSGGFSLPFIVPFSQPADTFAASLETLCTEGSTR
jgi:subtilisin family serine protease